MKTVVDINKIQKLREQKGLTQTAVAQMLGYKSVVGYHHIEKGRRGLSANRLLKLAEILEVNVADLTKQVTERDSA